MIDAPSIDPAVSAEIGVRALQVFTATPRLNRWLYSKLESHIRGDVLEIGGGIGNLSRFIVERASTVVVSDIEPRYLDSLRQMFKGDPRVTVADFDPDGEPSPLVRGRGYDTIVAVNVIEHIRDDMALIRRLAKLLRPGGKLAVYVPACPVAYGTLDRALGHYRRYTSRSLAALLSGAGLQVAPPQYMNLIGLIGWTLNGRVLRRNSLSDRQVAVFERLMPLVALEDLVRVPLGLGVYTAAQRAG